MTSPISGSGSTPSTEPVSSTTAVDSSDTESTVSSGYGSDDSVSYTEGDGAASESSEVSLDSPTASDEVAEDTLQQAIGRRLVATTRLLSFYSNHIESGGFDVQSDTASILLVLRGFVSDLKTINNAQNIATVANERQALQELRLEAAPLKVEIVRIEGEIGAKEEELADTLTELATNASVSVLGVLMSSLSTAEAGDTADPELVIALTSAFSGQPEIIAAINHIHKSAVSGEAPDPDQVSLVGNEIARLQGVVNTLQAEVATLTSEIASLKATNENNKILLAIIIAILAVTEQEEVLTRAYMFDPAITDEKGQREVGEKRVDALQEDLKRLLKLFEDEDSSRALQDSLLLTSVKQDAIESDQRQYANIDPQGIAVQLREVLLPEIFGDLAEVFDLQNADTLNFINNQDTPSPQDIQSVSEALAVVLLSGIENHHGNNALTDDNSGSFALSLLREKMIDELGELAAKLDQQPVLDGVSRDQISRVLDAERKVDELVLNARKDQTLSQAAIRRANRA
ncbi:hypothetical protein [Endozoicomonas ascidiicola]|uniref:hypothetical protein n=1 Tax=Endozoicomonas ascidiicola TaxID=1698521 RepID=UPI00082EB5B3|nr:hypothetical protein [Endozoicomonas ascidiicola]